MTILEIIAAVLCSGLPIIALYGCMVHRVKSRCQQIDRLNADRKEAWELECTKAKAAGLVTPPPPCTVHLGW